MTLFSITYGQPQGLAKCKIVNILLPFLDSIICFGEFVFESKKVLFCFLANVFLFGWCFSLLLLIWICVCIWYIYRASEYPREYDGACLQMRLSYSPCAHFFLFLVQWTDCHLAGALGLLRILIYKVTCILFYVLYDFFISLINFEFAYSKKKKKSLHMSVSDL